MRRVAMLMLLTALLLVACTPTPASSPATPTEGAEVSTQGGETGTSGEQPEAEASATAEPEASPTAEAMPTATRGTGRTTRFPNPIIVYQREGRFPGSPQQWTIYETGRVTNIAGDELVSDLPSVQALFAIVRAEGFAQLEGRYAPQGDCRDCTVHTITYYQPDSEPRAVTVVEGASPMPEDLQAALDLLTTLFAP